MIKFRAWDKESKTMDRVRRITWTNGDIADVYLENIGLRRLDEIILMQSTGLKDKNSVEIYEGDIIVSRYREYTGIGIGKYDREYREEFDNHPTIINPIGVYGYMFDYTTDGKSTYEFEFESCDAESSEVVGNIYQNPELLEVTE